MDETSSIKSPPKRKLSTRAYIGIALGVFAVTVALLYLQENIRGKLAWEAFKRQYEAKGKSLDWQQFIPPSVPDDQNIYKAPGMHSLVKGEEAGPVSKGIGEVNDMARKFEAKHVLVANIHLVADKGQVVPGINLAASPEEAVAAINSRGQVLPGPTGSMLCNGSLITGKPLELALVGQTNSVLQALQDKVRYLSVFATNANLINVYLDSAIPAEEYINAYQSQKMYFDQLEAALRRPFGRMDGDYSNPVFIPIQNFVSLRTMAQTLAQATQSYLLLGKPREALQALTVLHDSERLITAEPGSKALTLVAAMINTAIKGLYIQTVADGLRLGVWGEPEMAALQKQLETVNMLPIVRQSLQSELLAITTAGQAMPILDLFKLSDPGAAHTNNAKRYLSKLIPKGWILQNLARYGQLMEEQVEALSKGAPGIDPSLIAAMDQRLRTKLEGGFSPYIYISRVAIPNFNKAIQTTVKNQTLAQLANISLALERYRLAFGKYPDTLEKLPPTCLATIPRDLITGTAPIYRLVQSDKYLLYSVGWNEKDDGGIEGKGHSEGDWVWNPKK